MLGGALTGFLEGLGPHDPGIEVITDVRTPSTTDMGASHGSIDGDPLFMGVDWGPQSLRAKRTLSGKETRQFKLG